jgi:hypothetical protein
MLIQLSDGCHVAADQIAEVSIRPHDRGVTVRTKDGIGHHLDNDFRKSSYATQRRLVSEINDALGNRAAAQQDAKGEQP